MNKFFKLLLCCMLVLGLAVVAGCSSTNKASNEKVFRVGMECGYAPFNWTQTNADNGDIKDHQLTYVYKVHNNVNIYGAGTYIKSGDSEFGYQGGVIGHTDLTDRIKGYAKAGFGNDIKQSYQVGAAYALKPDIDLNVYYGYDKYSIDNNDKTAKGIHAGVGYSF